MCQTEEGTSLRMWIQLVSPNPWGWWGWGRNGVGVGAAANGSDPAGQQLTVRAFTLRLTEDG